MTSSIMTRVEAGVATLTLNRPKAMNSFDADTARAIVEAVEGFTVGQQRHRGARERPRHLCRPERQHLGPREPTMDGQGQRHRRVQVRPGDAARHVHPHDHGQAPAEVDRQVAPV